MRDSEKLREKTRELMEVAAKVHNRIGEGGEILGWRGFHLDLERLEDLSEELQVMVRLG